jgi:hypothetical protein
MAEQVYGFYKDVAKQLRDLVRGGGDSVGSPNLPPNQRHVAIAKAGTDVAGGTDAVPTTTEITLYEIDDSSGVISTGVTETGYNVVSNTIRANQNNFAIKEYISGKWVIVPISPSANYIVKTPAGGIAALSGTTPGTATITFQKIDGTNGVVTASLTETGYNIDCTSIPGEVIANAYREAISGKLIVIAPPITDLQLDGNELQYKRGCSWTTWTTGTDCPP